MLLIGGASGVGKSALTAAIARHHRVGTAEIDDLLAATRAVTTAVTNPALHRQPPQDATAETLVRLQIEIAAAMQPVIRAVVNTHLDHGPPVVIEGDYLLPGVFDQPDDWAAVSAIFLHEPDEAQIAANLAAREPARGTQSARAHVSRLFGDHLRDAAVARAVSVLPARPWATQLERMAERLRTG